jgi:histidinol-phosphate aminotransferase
MKYNNHINSISRLFIPRPTKEENKRFDMAERTFSFPKDYIDEFMNTIVQEDFITYPSYGEYDSLKDDIATYNNMHRSNVYLSTGSGACIKSLCEITMNVDSNIVSPVPCYPMYGIYGKMFAGKHIGVEYTDSIIFDLDKLVNNINDKTKLVVISNPFSPIGEYKTIDEIRELCRVCNEKDIILLIDEAYVDFAPKTVLPLVNEFDNVVVSRTFSKAFGAAGIRVGYLLGSKKLIDVVTKVQLTYPLSNISVKFASYLLNNSDEVFKYAKDTIKGRDNLCNLLSLNGYDVIKSHTNSIHFHKKNGDNSKTVEIMKSYGLAFKSGYAKTGTPVMVPGDDRKTWIRLSVGPDIDKMKFVGDIL